MKPARAVMGSTAFFFLAPGLVAGVVPWLIGRGTADALPWPVRALGAVIALAGLGCLLACFAAFVRARGTPAPVAPTERLVVEGLYRYVRNPMYVAVVTMVLGQAMWHGSLWVLLYGALVWAVVAAFVRFYEEPRLSRQFGSDYDAYRRAVHPWKPRSRPWPRPGDQERLP